MSLYQELAKHGLPEAQLNLGMMYVHGEEVSQDYKQAMSWYLKAAEQDFAAAQYNLSRLYVNGAGVSKNYSQASFWLKNPLNLE